MTKSTLAMYAGMPPQKKKTWTQRAEADKVCYCHKLSFYISPPCYDVKGDAIRPLPSNTAPLLPHWWVLPFPWRYHQSSRPSAQASPRDTSTRSSYGLTLWDHLLLFKTFKMSRVQNNQARPLVCWLYYIITLDNYYLNIVPYHNFPLIHFINILQS